MSDQEPSRETLQALPSAEVARKIERVSVSRSRMGIVRTLVLAVLAGSFIAFGGVLTGTIAVGSELGTGPTRLLMGLGFTVGLFMVVITGAELFTGNSLMTVSLFSCKLSVWALARNWTLVYIGNLIGALIVVSLIFYGEWWRQADSSFATTAVAIANSKVDLSFQAAFVLGIPANIMVCMAVWLATAGRTVTDKFLGVILPITALIAAGFEHSVANMYFLPVGLLISTEPGILAEAGLSAETASRLTVPWVVHNLAAASLGNIVGGGFMIGLAYWFLHLRGRHSQDDRAT